MAGRRFPVGPVAVAAAVVGFTWWLGAAYGDQPEWVDTGTRALMVATAAVGLNLLVGYTGLLSLGHSAFFVAGGLFGAVLAPDWGLSPWLGFPVAFVLGAVLGAALALMCCHLRGLYLTVVTLAFAALVPAVFTVLGKPTGERVTEFVDAKELLTAGGDYRVGLLWLAALVLLASLFLVRNLTRSRWGRAYMAIRESELAARASGVAAYWYKVSAFAVSAGIVAMAGVVGAQVLLTVSPGDASQTTSFRYVTVVAIGGMGTLLGPVLGGLALEFGLAVDWVQETFRDQLGLFFGILALAIVGLAPDGAMGLLARARHGVIRRWPGRAAGWLGRRPPVRVVTGERARPRSRSAAAAERDDEAAGPPEDGVPGSEADGPARTVSPDDPARTVSPDDPARTVSPDDPARTFTLDDPARTVTSDGPARTVVPDGPARTVVAADGPAGAAVLDVRGVTKRFGGLAALHDVDVAVARGTIHALIGPNGSGKSTLVNVVSGVYRPTAGQVLFQGRDVAGLSPSARAGVGVARTFQNLQVWRRMTVVENVMVGAHALGGPDLLQSLVGTWGSRRHERRVAERAWGLLGFVGLAARGHDPAGALPFADLRRLEIARALASDPDLLLLDEPAAGLHPDEIAVFMDLVRRVRDAGITVLLVEHHMEVVMGLSDRVSVLDHGQKIAEGTPEQVRRDPRVIEAYLGADEAVAP